MAGPIMRTFWTVEGKVDKDGHPIEYPTEAAATAQSSAGGIGGSGIGQGVPLIGGAPKPPTKVTESMTEDGEYVQTVDGPDGQPQEIGRGVDKARLELYNARRGAAKDAAKPADTDRYEYRNGPNGELLKIDKQTGAVTVEMGKQQGPAEAKAPDIHTNPDGSQSVFNPATGKYESYAPAKPAAGPAPGTEAIPAARPGQTIDLAAVKSQAQMTWDSLTADVQAGRITPEQRQQKWSSYYTATVAPALEAANREAVAEAERQRGRQAQADTIAQQAAARASRTEERQSSTAERQTKVAEDRLALDRETAGYNRGQDAVSNALKLLQYQVDPSFSPALAGIYNRIMPGAFQPGAFQTALPDLDAIAQAHIGPLLDMHASPVTGPSTQAGPAVPPGYPPSAPAQPPADPLANVPITPRAPYPQPGGTGIVGRFGQ